MVTIALGLVLQPTWQHFQSFLSHLTWEHFDQRVAAMVIPRGLDQPLQVELLNFEVLQP